MIAFVLLACGSLGDPPVSPEPAPLALAECGVCGMVVGEQPSPRGQLQYRDGGHLHTCSIQELRAQSAAPSSRGTPVGVWVEAVPADFDWSRSEVEELPWIPADEAHFVFGAERTGVMGIPVLAYEEQAHAAVAAQALGTRPVRWSEIVRTPFPKVPLAAQ